MSKLLLASLLTAFALAEVTDDGHGKTSTRLIDLDQASFDKSVVNQATNKLHGAPWLIMFYAPWCGHCKRLMPIFDEFAEKYGDGQALNVGRINCDNDSNLCTSYDVSGFPTVLYLNYDKFYEFHDKRTVESLHTFVTSAYKDADSDVIPQKLEGLALYQKQFTKFLGQLGRSIEILFHRIGFGSLPRPVMYSIAGGIFSLPIILMMYVICCMKDEVIEIPIKKKDAAQAKPVSKPREKLE